jgi:hypothetical protein
MAVAIPAQGLGYFLLPEEVAAEMRPRGFGSSFSTGRVLYILGKAEDFFKEKRKTRFP